MRPGRRYSGDWPTRFMTPKQILFEKIGSYATINQIEEIIRDIRETTGKYQKSDTAYRKLRELVEAGWLQAERNEKDEIIAYRRVPRQLTIA